MKYQRIFLLLLFTLSTNVFAATPLTGDQIKQLISGNTVELHSLSKDKDFNVYFSAEGTTTGQNPGKSKKIPGTWRIGNAGDHCTQWGKREETCGQILDMGDGTYHRMVGGAHHATWKIIHAGNILVQ